MFCSNRTHNGIGAAVDTKAIGVGQMSTAEIFAAIGRIYQNRQARQAAVQQQAQQPAAAERVAVGSFACWLISTSGYQRKDISFKNL